jgi:hypothetical protein
MRKYLTGFYTEQAAKDYSKECRDMMQNQTTSFEYLFSWVKHSTRTEWALIIPTVWVSLIKDGDESKLVDKLDATWWSAPEAVTAFNKYKIYWAEFASELVAEFNERNEALSGVEAINALTKLAPVLTAFNGYALGAARNILMSLTVDPDGGPFDQATKDYFVNKLNTYLAQWVVPEPENP